MSVEDDLREYLVSQQGWTRPPAELTADFRLIDEGVLDSLGIFRLVTEIESRYGIEVDDEELVREHFETLGDIARLVGDKVSTD